MRSLTDYLKWPRVDVVSVCRSSVDFDGATKTGLRSEARMIGFAAESAALPLRRRRSLAAASGGERARRRWRAAYSVRCCRGVNLPW
ncbi:hypothetical protein EGY16_17135 [Burkholderia pseudomallei]|nr:hypothetical protein EGY16_17135 [Burkholderia pseudomallei]PNW96425.1 hypothetical protein CF649_29245 [Burkholderia sp. 136(2017)]PNX11560.1 hypothetical protein CF650_29575 [Burkholderia sp. 129]PNX25517.1 hypothetical protein CF647_30115 [Burkholderia sp. 117]PNX33743.1 hypothetical protein CF648_29250 [Burkholderia sp. 137]